MARNGDELPRWAQIIIAAVIVGVIIWALVPRHIIWIALGIGIAIIGVVAYLAYKRQGMTAFTDFARRAYSWLVGTGNRERRRTAKTPPLPGDDTSLLIAALGSTCENPRCRSQFNLEVHHIKPRAENGSHSVWNLIVLCHGCHGHAGRGAWSRSLLKQWVKQHSRDRSRLVRSGKWKYDRYR